LAAAFHEYQKYSTNNIRLTDSTKNRSTLALPLNDTAIETLNALNALKEKSGDSQYVFPHFEGQLAGEAIRDIKNGWKTAAKRAGIINFRWHDLRHCFASWLVMKGVDLEVVQKLLGHRNIRITQRYAAATGGNLLALGKSCRGAAGEQLFTMNHNEAQRGK
jgi:site-specific recombinase XerD